MKRNDDQKIADDRKCNNDDQKCDKDYWKIANDQGAPGRGPKIAFLVQERAILEKLCQK